jgi:hypothetical protein
MKKFLSFIKNILGSKKDSGYDLYNVCNNVEGELKDFCNIEYSGRRI